MGLCLSILLSTWNEILKHKFFGFTDTIETDGVRSITFEKKGEEVTLRTKSFKKEDSETGSMFENNMKIERSISFEHWDSIEAKPEASKPSNSLVFPKSLTSVSLNGKTRETIQITKPRISLPEPVISFTPRPVSEVDAAATKLQKVYKSYRTRRNLADCAVLHKKESFKS